MEENYDFYKKQKKRQRLKNGAAVLAAMLLLVFVFLFLQYVEKSYTKDAASGNLIALNQDSFVTLISSGKTIWSYQDRGTMPTRDSEGRSWKEAGYNASGWKSGKGSFGSEEGKRTKQIKGRLPVNLLNHYTKNRLSVPIYYFRTEFNLKNPAEGLVFNGTVQFDDAVVIYLNGKKIYEGNVPAKGFDGDGYGAQTHVNDSITASFSVDDLTMLKEGRNVIAVEIHQVDSASSDVYFEFKSMNCQAKGGEIDLAAGSSIVLQPGTTENSITVNWLTKEKGSYKLQFAKKADFMKRQIYRDVEMQIVEPKAEEAHCYTAVIEDMEPDVEYVYRISNQEGVTSKQFEYKNKDVEKGFSFLLVGDPQIGAGKINDDKAGWQETIAAANSIDHGNAAFIISAGDQVDSADEDDALREYLAFRSPDTLRSLPVAVVRGNHETDNDLYDLQFQQENQNEIHDYYFTYGNTLFVHINSNNDDYGEHRKYLEGAIEKTSPKWIVVMMHYSLFGSGPHAEQKSIRKARNYYAKCFQELNVDLVVSGHDHMYSRSYLMNANKSTGKDGGTKEKGETMYLTGNSSSGSKFYKKNIKRYSYLAALDAKEDSYVTSIKISQNEMILTTMDTASMKKIDYCKIKK